MLDNLLNSIENKTGCDFVASEELSIIQKKFKIDYSKVESLEQVIDILKALDLLLYWYNENCPEQFKDLYEKGLLIKVE